MSLKEKNTSDRYLQCDKRIRFQNQNVYRSVYRLIVPSRDKNPKPTEKKFSRQKCLPQSVEAAGLFLTFNVLNPWIIIRLHHVNMYF